MKREDFEDFVDDDGEAAMIEKYRVVMDDVCRWNQLDKLTDSEADEAIKTTGALVLSNPDPLTTWTVRRRALLVVFYRLILQKEEAVLASLIRDELAVGIGAIKTNCKAYGAWLHRKWLVITLSNLYDALIHVDVGEMDEESKTLAQRSWIDVAVELKLCNKLLEMDARNFHCWNYRLFLFDHFEMANDAMFVRSEFDFTTSMIHCNFSNYSAWHRRSQLFPLLSLLDRRAVLQTDLEMIRAAYYTEPKDQSSWFYLRWILDHIHRDQSLLDEEEDFQSLLMKQIKSIEELLEMEPEASLALSTWVYLCKKYAPVELSQQILADRISQLVKCDPLRRNFHIRNL